MLLVAQAHELGQEPQAHPEVESTLHVPPEGQEALQQRLRENEIMLKAIELRARADWQAQESKRKAIKKAKAYAPLWRRLEILSFAWPCLALPRQLQRGGVPVGLRMGRLVAPQPEAACWVGAYCR